jgi:DNA-binding LacI/PurR family transcriptional regulator
VQVDNQHGACLATEHLIGGGHRRIAYIAGAANHSDDVERLAGYRQALSGAGITFDSDLVVRGTGRADGGEGAFPEIMYLGDRPTAAFCYNDMTAIGLLRAARSAGVRVPDELAVVGFDDIPFAAYVTPSLTTVAQPKPEMGRRAVEMALALAGAEASDPSVTTNVVLRGTLVVRESSGEGTRSSLRAA